MMFAVRRCANSDNQKQKNKWKKNKNAVSQTNFGHQEWHCCQLAQGTPNTGIARSKGRLRPFPLRGAPWPAKAGAFAHADRGGPKTLCSPILIPQFATLAYAKAWIGPLVF